MTNNKAPIVSLSWQSVGAKDKHAVKQTLPITIGRAQGANMVTLPSRVVSGRHARLEQQGGQVMLIDLGSKNGTVVNGTRIDQATLLPPNGSFQIGPYVFTIQSPSSPRSKRGSTFLKGGTSVKVPQSRVKSEGLTFHPLTDRLAETRPSLTPLPRLFDHKVVPVELLERLTRVETTTYLTVGGGLGSFAWVDTLVNFGADPKAIVAIGFEEKPYGRYQRLCKNSQIPDHERLRSNSDSCPDNIWGWPGYGVREMWRDFWAGRWRNVAKVGWQLFNEPFVPTYTPKAGDVFRSIEREAKRIGWDDIWCPGRVRAIRQTDDGRYAIAYSELNNKGTSRHRVILCHYLHVAVGYPGVRFLPDLQAYRQSTGDFKRVVNAYEAHDHIYGNLKRKGGVVTVRGRGIVASRIIQRLNELRTEHNAPIAILHIMRTPLAMGNSYQNSQREVNNHWEFQPFNWPKAAWGGELRRILAKADDEERDNLLNQWGGTTTADRPDWRHIVEQGLREGWYEIQFGNVQKVTQHSSGRVITTIHSSTIARQIELLTDYIIDATGLESGIESSPLLHDLAKTYDLPRNPKGRLEVSGDFELMGMRTGRARAFASGVSTLGGPYAPVDSFLGLQYAALRSVDNLVTHRVPGLRHLNGLRSLTQWFRWAVGRRPKIYEG